ncbi:MAG: glycosyltransferase [Myxococcota bacterium]|nr:glycosyltransferase [Myxococcota bacterium]MDW8362608.1 glycosyltransferase [Myxococcales bacterium]
MSALATPTAVVVIPCYNEAGRLDREQLEALLREPAVGLVLVDDGSRDGTADGLRAIAAAHPGRVDVVTFERNRGKAEAVRAGMRLALDRGARWVGYLDADFATPAAEMLRLLDVIRTTGKGCVLASRVARLGARVERRASRHLLGRVFATLASLALDLTVYDTQCGAKWFASGPELEAALARPFRARWVFDVELLGRLLGRIDDGPALRVDDVLEVPTEAWRDVRGSKLRLGAMARSLVDLADVARRRFARTRQQRNG